MKCLAYLFIAACISGAVGNNDAVADMGEIAPEDSIGVVRNITINRMNIFSEESADTFLTSSLINRFHYITRESVIQREVWFAMGDSISADDLEELERNIRELDLFAQVDVEVEFVQSDPETQDSIIDILVSTADRLSIVASTSGSLLGGIGEVSAVVGEKNLFGIGHSVELGYKKNTLGELLGSFAYDNIRFSGGDAVAGFRLGRTEEGDFSSIEVRNKFDNSDDRLSWKIDYDQIDTKIDFFDQGESVIEVPRDTNKLSLNRIYRHGDRAGFLRYGPLAEYKVTDYSAAIGSQNERITIPADSTELFLGGLLGYRATLDHVKVKLLDTLDYVQDLSFGYDVEIAIGATETLNDSSVETKPVILFDSQWSNRLGTNEFLSSKLSTSYVVERDQKDSWSASVSAKFYSSRFKRFTFASSLRYNAGFNGNGLPSVQSLGENNGLRGYPAREFNGEQSVLLNLESRIPTSIKFLTFRLGAVVFVDTGWIGDRNRGDFFDEPYMSTGFGARIGSLEIFGSGVFRLDIAFPLGEDIERDYEPTVSLSLGQVFEFD